MTLLLKASRLLLRHYVRLIHFYILAFLITLGLFMVLNVFGIALALPLGVSLAYITAATIISGEKQDTSKLFIGYSNGRFGHNLLFSTLRGLFTYLLTFILSWRIISYGLNSDRLVDLAVWTNLHPYAVIIMLIVIAYLPAFLIAAAMSMTPYLLADPGIDTVGQNPLVISHRILKGNYARLLMVRSFFLLWYGWILVGSIFLVMWIYVLLWGAPNWPFTYESFEWFARIYVISLIIHPFLIMPLKHVVHALLYTEIRHKASQETKSASEDSA